MTSVWIYSDPHFCHSNIVNLCERDFSDVHEMNVALVQNHNRVVGKDDVAICLGDFAFGTQNVKRFLSQMNGTPHLITGNHDGPFPGKKRHERERRRYLDAGFASVRDRATVNVGGLRVMLCHFPSSGDSTAAVRYAEYRPKRSEFDRLIHGHVHNSRSSLTGNECNVSCDVRWFAPVRAETIAAEIGVDAEAFSLALSGEFPGKQASGVV